MQYFCIPWDLLFSNCAWHIRFKSSYICHLFIQCIHVASLWRYYLARAVTTKTWVVRLKFDHKLQLIVISLLCWRAQYAKHTKHAELQGSGGMPPKNLKIDALRLHFRVLSEQHQQARQVIAIYINCQSRNYHRDMNWKLLMRWLPLSGGLNSAGFPLRYSLPLQDFHLSSRVAR